ncbi:hypothetical protein NQ176_g2632 [Zarea fungicola]|uniref:Uncharacterized protein n=1 Tax=Zarea fungicola TaxID=93591 RepID=A0ACC1NNG3_9HYPO|nr:hypothetical protein NQ176_g2632 [Lecanicillium fungicola]
MRSQPADSWAIVRQLRSVCDSSWTESLPIGVFLIHHPEGLFLFDTGQSPCRNNPGYLPRSAFFDRLLCDFTITPEDGIVPQLARLGVKPTDLKAIVLSHLHSDHTGGLEDLIAAAPDLPVYVGREHWKAFGERPFLAGFKGAAPNHWPKAFSPRVIDLKRDTLGPWEESASLTSDGRVVVVDTSGHVPGHLSLIVSGEGREGKPVTYFLTGDATYGIDGLEKEEPDGINDDPMRALNSLRLIKAFARQRDVVVLPSHDADTPRLLAEEVVYRPR